MEAAAEQKEEVCTQLYTRAWILVSSPHHLPRAAREYTDGDVIAQEWWQHTR